MSSKSRGSSFQREESQDVDSPTCGEDDIVGGEPPEVIRLERWLSIDGIKGNWNHNIKSAEACNLPVDDRHRNIAYFLEEVIGGDPSEKAIRDYLFRFRGRRPFGPFSLVELERILEEEARMVRAFGRRAGTNVKSEASKRWVHVAKVQEAPPLVKESIRCFIEAYAEFDGVDVQLVVRAGDVFTPANKYNVEIGRALIASPDDPSFAGVTFSVRSSSKGRPAAERFLDLARAAGAAVLSEGLFQLESAGNGAEVWAMAVYETLRRTNHEQRHGSASVFQPFAGSIETWKRLLKGSTEERDSPVADGSEIVARAGEESAHADSSPAPVNAGRENGESADLVNRSDVEPNKPTSRREQRAKWLAEAMLLVMENPDWSDARIAGKVGKDPSTLSRAPEYRTAAARARAARGTKHDIARGHQVRSDDGLLDVEAVSSKDDPAEMDWDE